MPYVVHQDHRISNPALHKIPLTGAFGAGLTAQENPKLAPLGLVWLDSPDFDLAKWGGRMLASLSAKHHFPRIWIKFWCVQSQFWDALTGEHTSKVAEVSHWRAGVRRMAASKVVANNKLSGCGVSCTLEAG